MLNRLAVIGLGLSLLSPVVWAGKVEVGWIDGFEGDAKDYRVQRDGQPLPVQLLLPLCEDDRLEVRHDTHRLTISLGHNRQVAIGKADSPYTVHGAGQPPTLLVNLMTWAGQWFTGLHAEQRRARVSLAIRGDGEGPLMVSLFWGYPLVIPADRRTLQLPWQGGKAPYTVQVTAADNSALVAEQRDLPERQVRLARLALAVGDYQITVRDASQNAVSARLQVTPASALPARPVGLEPAVLGEATAETLYAAWLAAQGEGRWRFEAYQRAASVAVAYPPAQLLRDALAAGDPAPALAQ